jgi:preprotein translocase subunit SecD
MPSGWWYKFLFVMACVVGSIVILIPTFFEPELPLCDPEDDAIAAADREAGECMDWPNWYRWYTENIYGGTLTKGLDLQGGLHLQYRVDVDTAIARRIDGFASDIENLLGEDYEVDVEVIDGTSFRVVIPSGAEARAAFDDAVTLYPVDVNEESSTSFRLEIGSDYIEETRRWAIDTAISTIRSRVDSLGVSEPSISRQGDSDIIIQLPGLGESEFEAAKNLIGTTAQLEFRGVHPDNGSYWRNVAGLIPSDGSIEYFRTSVEGTDLEELRQFSALLEALDPSDRAAPPEEADIVMQENITYHPRTGEVLETRYQLMLVNEQVEMTGETISDARAGNEPNTNRPVVLLTFDTEGRELFCDVSTDYINQLLAIVLDDIVKSAPRIESRICAGRAQITMGSTGAYDALYQEVQGLVIVLRHGALPAPIEPQFETQVGPSLGADSVRKGTRAMMIGSILVVLFMVFYYKKSGVIANIALSLNILFILAMLTVVHATITLPGIAGIILTVGMAVDANVIIFERIREELRLGKTVRDSISSGYGKALWTVLDANITTAIAAFILAQYGSGPIRGFAITLLFGIASSVFTALYVTRLIFDGAVAKGTKELSI